MYHISKEEASAIREAMEKVKEVKAYKRLQAVALRGEGKENVEIGKIVGIHEDMVGKYAKKYKEKGIVGLTSDGRVGGNHYNMSEEEGKEFLSKFEKRAEAGEIITVKEIAVAYDEAVGKVHESLSTIYSFLHKHGWRKITPRPAHPEKASEEEIAASKKT